jgi:hypothetical protein
MIFLRRGGGIVCSLEGTCSYVRRGGSPVIVQGYSVAGMCFYCKVRGCPILLVCDFRVERGGYLALFPGCALVVLLFPRMFLDFARSFLLLCMPQVSCFDPRVSSGCGS